MYNKDMEKSGGAAEASGFTIIEVMLTLAISGMVLVGALLGVSSTISRQRYRDTVEDIASTLRTQYDLVSRVQIEKRTSEDENACKTISGDVFNDTPEASDRGRTNCNVYGVAVALGLPGDGGVLGKRIQVTNLIGKDLGAYRRDLEQAGKDPDTELRGKGELALLKELKVTNLYRENDGRCKTTNILTNETFKWDASLETVTKNQPAKVLLMIVRSPRDGTIHTYVWNYSGTDNESMDYTGDLSTACNGVQDGKSKPTINKGLAGDNFKIEDVKLCIKSEDAIATYGRRRMLKIAADGHNSSAVALMNMDDGENECN